MNGLKRLFSRRRLYNDLSDEIQEHLAEKIEELVSGGMSRKEAAQAARREFGNVTLIEQDSRKVWQWPSIEDFLMDLRYGLRGLRKSPGFTAVAVLTLALGIGANTSVFSLSNFVLMRPLAVPHAERVTVVSRGGHALFSYPDFRDYQDRNQSFAALAASNPTESSLDYEGESRATAAEAVSASYGEVMKVQPVVGRWFADENEHVAVISYNAWRR